MQQRHRQIPAFSKYLQELTLRAGVTTYALSRFSGVSETYLHRLANGERLNPSRNIVVRICLALVRDSREISMDEVNTLILAAGHAPLLGRGEELLY